MFTKIKDLNLHILESFDDKTLLSYCLVDKYANKLCNDEGFWRRRFLKKFVDGQEEFRERNTWRQYYLLLVKNYDIIKGKFHGRDLFINDDTRISTSYRNCSHFPPLYFISIAWQLRYLPEAEIEKIPREEYIQNLSSMISNIDYLQTFTDERLRFYHNWKGIYHLLQHKGKSPCYFLAGFMKQNNLINS